MRLIEAQHQLAVKVDHWNAVRMQPFGLRFAQHFVAGTRLFFDVFFDELDVARAQIRSGVLANAAPGSLIHNDRRVIDDGLRLGVVDLRVEPTARRLLNRIRAVRARVAKVRDVDVIWIEARVGCDV